MELEIIRKKLYIPILMISIVIMTIIITIYINEYTNISKGYITIFLLISIAVFILIRFGVKKYTVHGKITINKDSLEINSLRMNRTIDISSIKEIILTLDGYEGQDKTITNYLGIPSFFSIRSGIGEFDIKGVNENLSLQIIIKSENELNKLKLIRKDGVLPLTISFSDY